MAIVLHRLRNGRTDSTKPLTHHEVLRSKWHEKPYLKL